MNELKLEEVFTLAPAESHELNEWIGQPYLSGPGRYRVALRYRNQPDLNSDLESDLKSVGIELAPEHLKTLKAFQSSTPMTAVSNTVEVIVE